MFRMAVNLSARQFLSATLLEDVAATIRETGMDPRWIEFEVTESVMLPDPQQAVKLLRNLKAMGVRLTIDDFGTGYSSLDHLREMPADILKIDRSFVAGMAANSPDSALVAAAIAMGRALEMEVVAEGIETSEQVADLRELGCPLGQGFLFARPLPPEELDGLLEADIPF
jgi:EAL domain-containing protein (putative c-di-GMP-specific phosphodiesterase class I)